MKKTERYAAVDFEVIPTDAEDVITTSGGNGEHKPNETPDLP